MTEKSSGKNRLARSTRYLLRLAALWFMAFVVCSGWVAFNVRFFSVPNWLDAIFGLGLILLLMQQLQLQLPSAPQGKMALR